MLKNSVLYLALLTSWAFFMAANAAVAVPSEGLEAFDIWGQGTGNPSLFYAQAGFVKPSFGSDYEDIETYASYSNSFGNYWTGGVELTAANNFGDRDAYFIRYDQVFSGQSISLKFTHQDLRYLSAGKDIFSLDYNGSFSVGSTAAFYLTIGAYYRFTINSWNGSTWNPFNWNTDDRDSFLEICLGSKVTFTDNFYITVDLNNRDPFLPFNGDDYALDFTLNLKASDTLIWRLTESTRFSGLLAGSADASEERIYAGIVTSF